MFVLFGLIFPNIKLYTLEKAENQLFKLPFQEIRKRTAIHIPSQVKGNVKSIQVGRIKVKSWFGGRFNETVNSLEKK